MRKIIEKWTPTIKPLLLLPLIGVCFAGCDSNSGYDYDNGYESAWEGEGAPTSFSSQKYRDGYEQGLQDAAMYDEGYYDGYNKKKCAYPSDPDYMDGYKDGKK
jgi:hypothetical protein